MSDDPYEQLEQQLREAVRRRRRSRGVRLTPRLALAAALVLTVGGGVATATVALEPGEDHATLVARALTAGDEAARTTPACKPLGSATGRRIVDDAAPDAITRQLRVLRRPATAADRLDLRRLAWGGREILRPTIRRARAADGWTFELHLARGDISFAGRPTDPVACLEARRVASLDAARDLPSPVRDEVAHGLDQALARARALRSGEALTVMMIERSPDGRAGSGMGTIIGGAKLPAVMSVGTLRVDGRRAVAVGGLVPDGVASIRVRDAAGTPRVRPVTVEVRDNVFHVVLPRRMGPRMVLAWRSADGSVVRTLHPRF